MSIKEIFRNDIVASMVERGDDYPRSIALVVKADESNNVCKIRYTSKKGKTITAKGVSVRHNGGGMIDWFPEEGQYVAIEILNGTPVIIGVPDGFETNSRIKTDNTIESDVYSDNLSSNTSGGYVY